MVRRQGEGYRSSPLKCPQETRTLVLETAAIRASYPAGAMLGASSSGGGPE
jgi:hypothetical protein